MDPKKKLNQVQTDLLIESARDAGKAMHTIIALTECTKDQAIDLIIRQYDVYTNYLLWQNKIINN